MMEAGLQDGIDNAKRKSKHLKDLIMNKINESPAIFMTLWTIPPGLMHLSWVCFESYTPLLCFVAGCIFMIFLETFILVKVFD